MYTYTHIMSLRSKTYTAQAIMKVLAHVSIWHGHERAFGNS